MNPTYQKQLVTIYQGNSLDVLRSLPAQSVHCCVTSPPYWGLRDYGMDGQIGLEETIEEYVEKMVEIFAEVKRVLRDNGTLWLNLGDSYARQSGAEKPRTFGDSGTIDKYKKGSSKPPIGLKEKDMCGIPWRLALALQQPYYTGKIKSELDRIWLAAIIDGEGSICGYTHRRKDNDKIRRGIHITITNGSIPLLDECFRIWPTSKKQHNPHRSGHYGKLDMFRWIAHQIKNKMMLLAEIYPYLIAKKQQALLAWNFLNISKDARGRKENKENQKKCQWLVDNLSKLNHQKIVTIPSWIKEPPCTHEPGWYLRQDIIWHKKNPVPESVKDRCTKAHEYIFLLTKNKKYYYDADAIKTDAVDSESYTGRRARAPKSIVEHDARPNSCPNAIDKGFEADGKTYEKVNKRSVWTVNTKPYKEAHFAVYPEALIEPCIKAGCLEGGIVLDPFMGSGTTNLVASKQKKRSIGIELNQEYIDIAVQLIEEYRTGMSRGELAAGQQGLFEG